MNQLLKSRLSYHVSYMITALSSSFPLVLESHFFFLKSINISNKQISFRDGKHVNIKNLTKFYLYYDGH